MNHLSDIHPGEVLEEEFLKPLSMTAYRLAKSTFMPESRIHAILKGERRVSADTALRLSKYFGTTARFWLDLQSHYDLEKAERESKQDLERIQPRSTDAA